MVRKSNLILMLLLSLSLTHNAQATNYCNHANAEGCYIYSEGSGTSLADQTSNNNDGTFASSGNPGWSSTVPSGYSNYAADFTGAVTEYIELTSDSSIELQNPLTVVSWANLDDAANPPATEKPIWAGNDSSSYFYLAVKGDNTLAVDKRNAVNVANANTSFPEDVYVHVGFVIDGSGDWEFFIDGVSDGTGNNNQTYTYDGNNISLGATIQSGVATNIWNGLLTEQAGFSTDLTSTEINDIMDNGLIGGGGGGPTPRRAMVVN